MLKATARRNKDLTWTGYVEVHDDMDRGNLIYSYSMQIKRFTAEDSRDDAVKEINTYSGIFLKSTIKTEEVER